jgi:hypothetical protein
VDTSFGVIASDGSLADTQWVTLRIDHSNVAPSITPIGNPVEVSFSESFVYYPTIIDPDDTDHIVTYLEYPHWCSVRNDSVMGTAPDTLFSERLTVVASDYCQADTLSFLVQIYMLGDVTGDEIIDVGDVVTLINYLFKNGSAPEPFISGDANCDGNVDIGDVVYLINYLYKAGTAPECP